MNEDKRFQSLKYGEIRTNDGKVIRFASNAEEFEKVQSFLKEHLYSVTPQVEAQVNISHGAYGRYSRYEVAQLDYAGAPRGYAEVLEISDPPDNRCGHVINQYDAVGDSYYTEWATIDDALRAFEKALTHRRVDIPNLPGFKRLVHCGALVPWFYAIGEEELVKDYAFPHHLQNDALYRFGESFMVFSGQNPPVVKTCMGTEIRKDSENLYRHRRDDKNYSYRVIYWDDGTIWNEAASNGKPPRRLEQGEMWKTEAVHQFKKMLASGRKAFTVSLNEGDTFIGTVEKY